MNYADDKLAPIQQIIASENKSLINHLQAIFSTQGNDWRDSFPPKIKASLEREA